jgi:uncharacterized protein YdeI (YjbR/CyaY-like superfamily)
LAKYYFWVRLDKLSEYVEVPDELLECLDEKQKEKVLFQEHNKWCRKQYCGDWELVKSR